MIVVPTDRKILIYGPAMIQVESEYIVPSEYAQLPRLRDYMVSMMRGANALGLSAPQVGVFKNFFVFQMANGVIRDMVNPEITRMHGKEVLGMEACLSVPPAGNECLVPRIENITVEYATADVPTARRGALLSHRDSVVVQHEVDHLTGTFFFDRVSASSKNKVLETFSKWKQEIPPNVTKENARQLPVHSL